MTEPFLGQIMPAGFQFAPKGFALCNGQILPIQQNSALFSLLGVIYGGNGTLNFALPDLRGRTPFGAGSSVDPSWQPAPLLPGAVAGVENVTLTSEQIPPHSHGLFASSNVATESSPDTGYAIGKATGVAFASPGTSLVPLNGGPMAPTGALPHANMQPFLTINMCIALSGVYPSRG
jgi:microcystin-dependent protein